MSGEGVPEELLVELRKRLSAEFERVREEAWSDGRTSGLADGRAQGIIDGRGEGVLIGSKQAYEAAQQLGRVIEARKLIVQVLVHRALVPSPEQRRVLLIDSDIFKLERWHERALRAFSVDEIMA